MVHTIDPQQSVERRPHYIYVVLTHVETVWLSPMIYFWILFKDKNHFHPQVMHSTKRCKPESGKACQWSSAVRSSSLFPWCIWAWGASSGGASLKRRRPFFPNLGLQFCHQLVKVLASANHFSSLVDGVDLMRIKRTVSIYLSGFES